MSITRLLLLQILFLFQSSQIPANSGSNLSDSDSLKVLSFIEKSNEIQKLYPDSAFLYAQKALEISNRINYQSGIGVSLKLLGNISYIHNDYENALKYLLQSLQHFNDTNYFSQVCFIKLQIATIYNIQGLSDKAISLNFEIVKLSDSIDNIEIKSLALQNIGEVYRLQHNGLMAVKYLQEAYTIVDTINNRRSALRILHNLALANELNGDSELALFQLNKCLEYSEVNQTMDSARIFHNMGKIYIGINNPEKAKYFLNKALHMKLKIGNAESLGFTYNELGTLYLNQDNFSKARDYLQKAYNLTDSSNKISLLVDISRNLSDAYKGLGDYEKALYYETEYGNHRFFLYNQDKNTAIAEIEARYESEKKEQENIFLRRDAVAKSKTIKKQRFITFLISILFVVMATSAIFAFRAYLTRKKLLNQINKQYQQLGRDKKTIEEQTEKLKSLDKLKSNFFANISHEFRTPLTLILGPLEQNIKEQSKLSEQDLKVMYKQAKLLLDLINQILSLSKLESGSMKLAVERINFTEYLKGLVMSFSSLALLEEKELLFKATNKEIDLFIDRNKIDRVILNILSNAFKFTTRNDIISVCLFNDNEYVTVEISDTGIGIAEDEIQHIFKRFYQTESKQNPGKSGTGIGLELVKQLVDLHNGVIEVKSEPEKGTTFSIMLLKGVMHFNKNNTEIISDLVKKSDYTEFANIEHSITESSEPSHFQIKPGTADEIILIVEDNSDVRRYIRKSIDKHYKILEASNGNEGFEMACKYIPDLIISDVMMPEMDGIELTKLIKTDIKTSHIPVVLLTAKADAENKIEGLETGADDYLSKPFLVNELIVRIRNLITQRKNLRKIFSKNLMTEPEEGLFSQQDRKFMKMIRLAVLENMHNEGFDVEELSMKLNISRSNLFRKIKALTDQSPSQYIRTIRLHKSTELLKNANIRINEIAYKVGFSSVNYFNRCFKEEFGVSPGEFPIEKADI